MDELREKLRKEVLWVDGATLLPHQRRDALLILTPSVDLLDAAVAIATDDKERIGELLSNGCLTKPTLAQMSDYCVQPDLRFQFVILQPYVLAQPMVNQN